MTGATVLPAWNEEDDAAHGMARESQCARAAARDPLRWVMSLMKIMLFVGAVFLLGTLYRWVRGVPPRG